MIRVCPACGGPVLTTSMTEDEEQRYAAAFRCTKCFKRYVELWPERGKKHVAVEEK